MSPKVSVVMPVYNAERTLPKAIDSILNQTFRDFEFILVDDGSKDGSWKLISEYAGRDTRIRPIQHAINQGNTAARNTGSGAATGEYIAVQDADDVSLPRRLEAEVDYLEAHPEAGAVASPAHRIDGQDRIVGFWPVPATPDLVRAHLLLTNPLPHTTVMVRRALFESLGGYHTLNAPDHDLLWRISQVSEIHTLSETLAHYRSDEQDQNRITVGQASKQVKGSQEISIEVVKKLMDGKPFDEEAYRRLFMSIKRLGKLGTGDVRRLQPLWDRLAAEPTYRQVIGPKLLSCCLRNMGTSPLEAVRLLPIIHRQFGISWSRIVKKYVRYFVLDPIAQLRAGAGKSSATDYEA